MNQYLLLIHRDATSEATAEEWSAFFEKVGDAKVFLGGSELGARELVGSGKSQKKSEHIAGYMRFEADDKEALLALLEEHPVVKRGGTVELCDLPESGT